MADVENQETPQNDIQAPAYLLWGGKIAVLIASLSWVFGGFWNFLKIIGGNWNCIVAGVLDLLFALTIWCIEAAVLVQWGPCKPGTTFIAEKTSIFKIWQKSGFYFCGACTCLFFCTASATANLFGFFLTLAGAGCYGFAAYKHKTATGELA